MNLDIKELLRHRFVLGAFGVVGFVLLGSIVYYLIESRPPAISSVPATNTGATTEVTATGTVTPVENPDLSFAVSGRVALVNVHVGDVVQPGELLASLDTGILSANLAAANANFAGLTAPPRAVDLAGKQTMLAAAEATLANNYAALPSVLADAIAKTADAVHATDSLFSNLNSATYPTIRFSSNDNSAADSAGRARRALRDGLPEWQSSVEILSAHSSEQELNAALDSTITNLATARAFFDHLASAATAATPLLSSSDMAAVTSGRTAINGLIISLQGQRQTLSNEKLAVQSAQDALDMTNAGATPEAIAAARAQVNAAAAALAQAEIVAPFQGTVASVGVKSGDVASPNAPAISVLPHSNFEVEIRLSEIDVAKITVGDTANVSVDAYGPNVTFPAKVATIDRTTSVANGVSSYKVTLVFTENDTRLFSGEGANVTIHI